MSPTTAHAARVREFLRAHRRRVWAVVVVVLVYLFVGGSDGFYAQWEVSREIDELREEIADMRVQIARERELIERLQSDMELIERIARERDGMVLPGEQVYRVVSPSDPQEGQEGD